jgi:SpoVK/Ycf46/Vps4 family AAA+-type ATPase
MEKNEFYDLLDGIVECADKVAKLGKLLKEFVPQFVALLPDAPIDVPAIEAKETKVPTDKKKAATKKAEPKVEEIKEETPTYSFEDVRKAFAAKSHAGHTAEVKALITKYGASRLSDIQESDYTNLMADLEVIG